MQPKYLLILFLLVQLCAGCSLTRGLPEGQKIYYKTTISFTESSDVSAKERLKENLAAQSLLLPVSGLEKLQVNIYNNSNKKKKEKGFSHWFQTTIGRPPVIYDAFKVETSRLRMEKYLLDHGYFDSEVKVDSSLGHRKVLVEYIVRSSPRYRINKFEQEYDSLFVGAEEKLLTKRKLINKKIFYAKELIDAQRLRQTTKLNDLGYFKIRYNNFYYVVDTTVGGHEVNIYNKFAFKDTTESQRYYFGSSLVYTNYSLTQSTEKPPVEYNGIGIIQSEKLLKANFLNTLVWNQQGEQYNKTEEQKLLQRFLATNLFKFVNLDYEERRVGDSLLLDRYLYLTPRKVRNVNLDLQLHNTLGNIFGTQIGAGYTHFNLFKGAEKLKITTAVNGEFQTGQQVSTGLFSTLDYQVKVDLGIPGIRVPFKKLTRIKGAQLPRTFFNISNQLQQQPDFYVINSAATSFGYRWFKKEKRHSLSPISVNYVDLISDSKSLRELLDTNIRVRQSFEDLFILSMKYEYNHSKQFIGNQSRSFSYSLSYGAETAGTVSSLIVNKKNADGKKIIGGIPFSQFVKFDLDYRPKIKYRKGLLATRFVLGVGLPYGNSSVLPYIKQYIVGGANSMRAFDIRTLGPGSYENLADSLGTNFVDQTGDIRLEANIEYRFPIFSYLKGAAFVDIGNVWLANRIPGDPNSAVSVFEFKDFYKELGMGAGFGFRLDFDIAVLRLDLAVPIHDPRDVDKWVVKNLGLSDIKYRIGVGYPF